MASVRRGDVPRDGVKASESLISPSWKVSGKRPAGAVCHGSKSHSGRFLGSLAASGRGGRQPLTCAASPAARGNAGGGQWVSLFGDWTGWWAASYRVCASHAAHHRACGFPRGSTLAGLRIVSGRHSCRVRFPATSAALFRRGCLSLRSRFTRKRDARDGNGQSAKGHIRCRLDD